MHDLTAIGILWAAVLTVVFVLPDVLVSTKYQLAGLASVVTLIGSTVYFGWERIYARRSFVPVTLIGLSGIIVLMYMGYFLDNLALSTWQLVAVNGVVVVTWWNLFGILLFLISALMYYWSFTTVRSIVAELRQVRQEEAEKEAVHTVDSVLRH